MMRRFGLTVLLPGIVLLLFGLRALQQDREAADRQVRDRLENAAELAARAIDGQLANWQQFRSDGIALTTDHGVQLSPWRLSAYQFPKETAPEGTDPALAEAEQHEIRGDWEKAIALYRGAAAANTPRLRAQALHRLARTYAKAGKRDLAVKAYEQLLRFPEQRIGAIGAELLARFELCILGVGDRPNFYRDLVAGRWQLDKARYLFYSESAREWVSDSDPARATEREKLAASAAIEEYLRSPRRFLGNYVAFWNEAETLIVPAVVLRRKLEESVALDRDLRIQLADIGSPRAQLSGLRSLSDRDLPYAVVAAPLDPARLFAAANQRRGIYISMLALVFSLLVVGSYMTMRAVNREVEVARLKSEFVSTVSHEFRSPLTAIRQLSELLQRGRVTDEKKRQEYYGLISRESGRLSRLVENLLDFSRMEEGRKQYHFERLDTAEWLRELASGFDRGNVNPSIPADLPPIQGDRVALTSAVENLLDNAVKYSPATSEVAFEAEASGPELTIRIRDRGCGIADEDRGHIFERFYRGKGEISRQVKGAGVGLSLVRQIVLAHGGHVDFDSRPGEGSEFRIRLRVV